MLPPFASLGANTTIVEPITTSCPERIDIGEEVYIAAGAWLSVVDHHNGRDYDPRLWIGDRASLGPGLVISCIAEVSIGEAVLTGPRVFIGDAYHDYRDPHTAVIDQPMSTPRPIVIGAGAFLGVHCAVLPGVTIGERAYVGANAVVTRDVPANAVVAGNPARVVRRWDTESERWVAGRSGDDRDRMVDAAGGDALRERVSHLEQRLALANRDRLALAKRLSAAERSQEGRDAELAGATERLRVLAAESEQLHAALGREQEDRCAAEHWLAQLRGSASWRATTPLRSLKRAVHWRHG